MYKLGYLALITLALIAFCSAGAVYKPTNEKIVIGYWGCNPGNLKTTTGQLQTALTKGYNVIIFAFYLVDANGGLSKDFGSVDAPTKPVIQAGTTRQFSYLISLFGGQNGAAPPLTISPNAWAQNMYNNFVVLHNQYGFDGIDIDLENSWGTTENEVACGLRTFFKLMHNAGFVVSMAPQTTAVWSSDVIPYIKSSWNSYVPLLDSSIIDYVDIVAIQLYNNPVPFNDAGKYTKSLVEGFQVSGCPTCDGTVTGFVKIPACKLAHGWPSTNGAAPAGCSTPSAGCPYGNTLSNLYAQSADLTATAGTMTWAIEWDEFGGWAFINAAAAIPYTATVCGASSAPRPPVVSATVAPTARPPPIAAATTKPYVPATAAPATAAPYVPATAAPYVPATAAPYVPATAAPYVPATAAPYVPATAAPYVPATAAPVPATAAPSPPVAPINTRCNLVWAQTATSSWQAAGGVTVTQFSVTVTPQNGSVKDVKFTMSPASSIVSSWSIVKDVTPGVFGLERWMYNSDGVITAGTSSTFGYIINSASPATFSLVGDPCQ